MRLPLNDKKDLLKTNILGAAARTRNQQRQFIKEKEAYGVPCVNAFNKLVAEDQVERVNMNRMPQGLEHYLPWRGIMKTESQTTKCRLVMDASAKPSASDVSLNQCLYQGPNMILDLVFCLIKFMKGIYAAVSDIEKAFLKILIDLLDRDVLRFFFPEDPFDINSRLLVYRFKVVMFGCISSPFLLAAVLEKLISEETQIDFVKKAIRNGLFVDNSGFASDNVDRMVEFYTEARRVLKLGNFNLRQWSTNCKEVKDLATKDQVQCEENTVKVLGLMWNVDDDILSFKTDFKWNRKFTKRSCLQFINAVYDPLNCLGPYAIRNRLFVQTLWYKDYNWDESFEDDKELVSKWMAIVQDTEEIARAKFRRRLVVQPETEIHVFGDASKEAYGAVAYVRTPPCKDFPNGDTRFVVAKGKIVPKKGGPGNTIPKLELTAMKIAANLVVFCQNALEVPKENRVIIWCDAQAVLAWVSSANLANTFVHERVKQIRQLCPTAEVRYVDTANNPADIITREQKSPEDFINNVNWWQGPRWLLKEESWPKVEKVYNLHPELKVSTNIFHTMYERTVAVNVIASEVQQSILREFGSRDFKTSVKALAFVIRFIHKSWPKKPDIIPCKLRHFTNDHIGPEEFALVQTLAIKIMQKEAFYKEIELLKNKKPIPTGPYATLDLFLDEQDIIRCRGRLEFMVSPEMANAPVLVDTDSPFTTAFIGYQHRCANCSSNNYTLHRVRQVMHGLRLRKKVTNIVSNCRGCKYLRAKAYRYPPTPPIPKERLKALPPFAITGVDYCGPHTVRRGEKKVIKVWVCVFTCLVTRAIHLEVVPDNTAITFLGALTNMAAIYRTPEMLVSDNATNFTKCNKMLREIALDRAVIEKCTASYIKWKFIPVKSAWFGGIYERMVGLVKKELNKLSVRGLFSEFQFGVTIREIQSIVNSRPLTVVGNHEVLTPFHLLNGFGAEERFPLTSVDTEKVFMEAYMKRKELPELYTKAQDARKKFWKEFQKQYLESIKFSSKPGTNTGFVPNQGDVVIIHEDDPRFKWKKAIVTQVLPSEDGQIRKCKIKIQGSKRSSTRAVSLLYPLELSAETFVDKDKLEYSNQLCQTEEENDFEGFMYPDHTWRQQAVNKLAQDMRKMEPFVYATEEEKEAQNPPSEEISEDEEVFVDSSDSPSENSEDEVIVKTSKAIQASAREIRAQKRNSKK